MLRHAGMEMTPTKKKKAVFMLSDPRSRRHMVHYAWPHGGHQVSKAQREQGMHMQKHWL